MSSFCHLNFFSKKFQHICVSLDVNFNESLTNNIVSFEQLDPVIHNVCSLENLFLIYSPKKKGQLTWNLMGSIRVILCIEVTCRAKITKIVMIGNPRWPPCLPSWKCVLNFFSWTKRPTDSKLGRKYWGDLKIKYSSNTSDQKPHGHHLENQFWTSSPESKGIVLRFGRKYQGDLQIKNNWYLSHLKSKMPAMAGHLENVFELLQGRKAKWLKTW